MVDAALNFCVPKHIGSRYFLDSLLVGGHTDHIREVAEPVPGEPTVFPLLWWSPRAEKSKDYCYLDLFSPQALACLQEGNGVLLFDGSPEGGMAVKEYIELLHKKLDELRISPRKVVFLTQNIAYRDAYQNWLQKSGLRHGMVIEEYHYWLRQMSLYVRDTMIPSGEFASRRAKVLDATRRHADRRKHFLSLNFTPRTHRLALMLYLLRENLMDKGLVSFPAMASRKMNMADQTAERLRAVPFPNVKGLVECLPALYEKLPLHLDAGVSDKPPILDSGQDWYYEQTRFSVVTETDIKAFGGGPLNAQSRRFTEKSFKPMLGLHPFLVIGVPMTLAAIRRYGFQTFAPFIDETYDTVDNDKKRTELVLCEIHRLCALSDAEINAFYDQLLPILLFNYDRFAGDIQKYFFNVVEKPLLMKLRDLAHQPLDL